MFYNIAKKQEVNPFENVTMVAFAHWSTAGSCYNLKQGFDMIPDIEVKAHRVCNTWLVCYPLSVMDFVTRITWFSANQGLFVHNHDKIGFKIVDNVLLLRCGQW